MFLSEYRLGTGAPGAPAVDLNLAVDAPSKKESGLGKITQAVNPPLNMDEFVHGSYDQLQNQIVATLTGVPAPAAGAEVNFGASLVLPAWGKPGEASFWYRDGDGRIQQIGPVPARPIQPAT